MRRFAQLLLLSLYVFPNSAVPAPSPAPMPPAEISKVDVVPTGDTLKINVALTGSVLPRVLVATNPDRLVLELPNTRAAAKQQHIAVNQGDVKDLRIGLTSTAPLVTRLVVDLAAAAPYALAKVGNTVSLTVLPATAGAGGNSSVAPGFSKSSEIAAANIPVPIIPVVQVAVKKRTRMGFRVKYIAEGAVYLAGGSAGGLQEGMHLSVQASGKGGPRLVSANDDFPIAAELCVVSVAANSAVTEVNGAKRPIQAGDWAYLSVADSEALLARTAPGTVPKRTFSTVSNLQAAPPPGYRIQPLGSDPSDTGHIRARVGLDYSGVSSHGSTIGSGSQLGLSVRTDITRIGGSYWNLQGYWRGRITHRTRPGEETLRDVLNKTYTMELDYDNPNSKWVAGVGRLYLPWANSLDTIDGGYFGRRVASGVTVGAFAGSTPDPTSWHYNPDRQIGGTFVNFEGGSYDSFRYTSTAGIALSGLKFNIDKPFVFFENGLYYKNTVSVYHSLIADAPQGLSTNGITPGPGISRSYLTVHYQPYRRVSFDFYHNYFRDVPTAATQLVGTGLVDKLLYQGFSVGARVEPVRHLFLYGTLGQSDKTGDEKRSLNSMEGITWEEIGRTGLRADFRYSKFDSSFAEGDYKVLTLSRHLGDRMMWDAQVGSQNLTAGYTANRKSFFVDSSLDMNLSSHTYLQSGYTVVRGAQASYNQWFTSLGYRFDARPEKRALPKDDIGEIKK